MGNTLQRVLWSMPHIEGFVLGTMTDNTTVYLSFKFELSDVTAQVVSLILSLTIENSRSTSTKQKAHVQTEHAQTRPLTMSTKYWMAGIFFTDEAIVALTNVLCTSVREPNFVLEYKPKVATALADQTACIFMHQAQD